MKKIVMGFLVVIMGITCVSLGFGEDQYKGKEELSVFQRLSDLIEGKYEIKGKPIKQVGVFQAAANDIKESETLPVK